MLKLNYQSFEFELIKKIISENNNKFKSLFYILK